MLAGNSLATGAFPIQSEWDDRRAFSGECHGQFFFPRTTVIIQNSEFHSSIHIRYTFVRKEIEILSSKYAPKQVFSGVFSPLNCHFFTPSEVLSEEFSLLGVL